MLGALWIKILKYVVFVTVPESSLTLIRAAGGVYDFRNFEQVLLRNGLSYGKF
jgi:hypothetical protein